MVDRRRLTLYCATALICMIYGLMTPFLPILAKDKHLSSADVGIIFAAFPFSGMLVSPVIGSLLYKVGRRNTLSLAFALIIVGFLAAGVSVYLGALEFFLGSLASRAACGTAFVFMFTTGESYAVLTVLASDYPEKVFEYVGINESMVGLGFLLGPLAGAALYVALGFAGTFFAAAGFYAIVGTAVYYVLGPDREYRVTHKDEPILVLATRPKVIVTMLPLMFGCASLGAQSVFISTHLEDNGLTRQWIAASFAITGVGYLLTCLVLAKTIEGWNRKFVNSLGCAVSVMSMALVGPWPSVFPESIPLILLGFALMPLGLGLLFVEVMPSLIEVCTKDLQMENDDKLLDKLSGTDYVSAEQLRVLVRGTVRTTVAGVSDS